jgi:hypothetical protein
MQPNRFALVLAAAALASAPTAAQDHTDLYVPFDGVSLTGTGTGVVLSGSAVFAVPDASYVLLPGAPPTLVAHLPLRGAITVEVTSTGVSNFAQTLASPPLILPAVEVAPGISVVPVVALTLLVQGHAEPQMRLSATSDFVAPVTVAFGTQVDAALDATPVVNARTGTPELPARAASLSVTVEAGVACLLLTPGAGSAGVFASVRHGFDLQVNTVADPWWSLGARLAVLGGDLTRSIELADLDLDVADAGAAFPGGAALRKRWSRAWDLGGGEDATSIAVVADGTDELVLVGNTSGVGSVGWLARAGLDGVLAWEEKSTQVAGGNLRPEVVHAAPDGGLLVAGNEGLTGGLRLDRLDGSGAAVWSRRYAAAGTLLFARGLVVRPDGGAVLAGRRVQGGTQRPIAVWIAPDGTVESALALDLGPAVGQAGFTDVAAAPDGSFAFGGYAYLNDAAASLASRNGLVARIDAQQTLAFARVLGGPGYDDGLGVGAGADGRTALAGRLASGDPQTAWVAILEADGALLSSNLYSDAAPGSFESAVDVDAVPGAGFVVTGERGLAAAREAWLFQVDGRGMPVWWKTVQGTGLDQPAEVRAIANGVLLCGRTDTTSAGDPPQSDLWAARTDVDGMLRLDPALGFSVVNPPVTWRASGHTSAVSPPATLAPFALTASTGALVPVPTAAGVFLLSI